MIRALHRALDRRRQADGHYGWLFNPYTGDEMVAISCEASGLDPKTAGTVSIGAVRLTGERVLAHDSLVLCLRDESGETPDGGLPALLDFIGNRPLLGWRIDADRETIDRYLRPRLGFDLPNATLDMAYLYRREIRRERLCVPELRFETLAQHMGIPLASQRSVLGNALAIASMYVRLQQDALAIQRC